MTKKNSIQLTTHFDVSAVKPQGEKRRCAALSFMACLYGSWQICTILFPQ